MRAAGHKWQYQCPVCMLDLYQRCGGVEHLADMEHMAAERIQDLMERPQFSSLHSMFKFWDSSKGAHDPLALSYNDFFRGFLCVFVALVSGFCCLLLVVVVVVVVVVLVFLWWRWSWWS